MYTAYFSQESFFGINTIVLSTTEDKSKHNVFVIIENEKKPIIALQISYSNNSPFKQLEVKDDLIVFGYGDSFGMYNVKNKQSFYVELDDYFGSFLINNINILICSGTAIFNIDFDCGLLWQTKPIAVDGIVIANVENGTIYCDCEMDPPGGWIERKLLLSTGEVIDN